MRIRLTLSMRPTCDEQQIADNKRLADCVCNEIKLQYPDYAVYVDLSDSAMGTFCHASDDHDGTIATSVYMIADQVWKQGEWRQARSMQSTSI